MGGSRGKRGGVVRDDALPSGVDMPLRTPPPPAPPALAPGCCRSPVSSALDAGVTAAEGRVGGRGAVIGTAAECNAASMAASAAGSAPPLLPLPPPIAARAAPEVSGADGGASDTAARSEMALRTMSARWSVSLRADTRRRRSSSAATRAPSTDASVLRAYVNCARASASVARSSCRSFSAARSCTTRYSCGPRTASSIVAARASPSAAAAAAFCAWMMGCVRV